MKLRLKTTGLRRLSYNEEIVQVFIILSKFGHQSFNEMCLTLFNINQSVRNKRVDLQTVQKFNIAITTNMTNIAFF